MRLLVVLAVTPAISAIAYQAIQARHHLASMARDNAMHVARIIATDQIKFIAETRQFEFNA